MPRDYLDKLNPLAKWVIIPRIVTGKDFPRDKRAFEALRRLMKARNEMVHFKSFQVPFEQEKIREILEEPAIISAGEAYRTIHLIMVELQTIDPGFAKILVFVDDDAFA